MRDRSCRPHRSPRRTTPFKEKRVLELRDKTRSGPNALGYELGMPASTVHRILSRNGKNRRPRGPKAPVIRYEHTEPGSLLHVDFKELARIGGGKLYQLTAVDDYTREVYAELLPKATTVTATEAFDRALEFYRQRGVQVRRCLTDNGWQFTMAFTGHPRRRTKFEAFLRNRGIKHSRTKPHSPCTNGKVERFHRTIDDELYKVFHFQSEAERASALATYLVRYNTKRHHQGIRGLTPTQRRERFFTAQQCQQCA